METSKLNRINELYKKSQSTGLSDEEKNEQFKLRNEYIDEFRQSMKSTLDNTYIQQEDGSKVKLQQKSNYMKH